MAKVVAIAESPPDDGPTADEWCRGLINATRPIFRSVHWPLPFKGGKGAAGVRARSDLNSPKHYKVRPASEQHDRYFLVLFPATEPTDEAIARQIILGLTHVAVAEQSIQLGAPYESQLLNKGQRFHTVRAMCDLLDESENLTRTGLDVVARVVSRLGHYPEGPSNRKPKIRMQEAVDMRCSNCKILWIKNWAKERYEDAKIRGGLRCPCKGVLVADNDPGEVYHLRR